MSELDALAVVLEGTNAAVYAYGIVAARVNASSESQALDAMAVHRAQREYLRERIIALKGTPPAPFAAYDTPIAVTTAELARRLAALVENRLAGQWAALAAASGGLERRASAVTAEECAVRAVTWSGEAPVWPGSQ
ncbi:MAG: ferritin-like domain-containing protein [Actinomycetes bacterium]